MVPAALGVALVAAHVGARAFLGAPGAVVAALLAALSPAMVFYSRYYIHETPLVLFTFGALLGGCWYRRRPGAGPALVTGACVGLMLATKETAPLAVCSMLAALGSTLVVDHWRGVEPRSIWTVVKGRDALLALLAALAVGGVLFSSFLGHPAGLVDSVRAYWTYFDRANAASCTSTPGTTTSACCSTSRPREPPWTEGLVVVLAIAGAAAGLETLGSPPERMGGCCASWGSTRS